MCAAVWSEGGVSSQSVFNGICVGPVVSLTAYQFLVGKLTEIPGKNVQIFIL